MGLPGNDYPTRRPAPPVTSTLSALGTAATGSVDFAAVAGGDVTKTFTLNDGVNATKTFEVTGGGGASGSNIEISLAGGPGTYGAAGAAAINGAASLAITAWVPYAGSDLILLRNDTRGAFGNIPISYTTTNLVIAGMSYGTGASGESGKLTCNAAEAQFSGLLTHGLGPLLSVASNTIAPTHQIHHVGAGLIKTITVPSSVTAGFVLHLIPDAAFTYDATGNLVVPAGGGTAVTNRLMSLCWDGLKWRPSY